MLLGLMNVDYRTGRLTRESIVRKIEYRSRCSMARLKVSRSKPVLRPEASSKVANNRIS